MRTAISAAAPPRRLRGQAAFAIKAYRTLSRVVWHHAFVSDTRMGEVVWRLDLFLIWFPTAAQIGKRDGEHPGRHPLPLISPNLNVDGVAAG